MLERLVLAATLAVAAIRAAPIVDTPGRSAFSSPPITAEAQQSSTLASSPSSSSSSATATTRLQAVAEAANDGEARAREAVSSEDGGEPRLNQLQHEV